MKFDVHDPEVRLLRDHPDKLAALVRDLKRAQATGQISWNEDGLMVLGSAKMVIGGVFESSILRHELVQKAVDAGDPGEEAWARKYIKKMGWHRNHKGYFATQESRDHNLIPNDGLDFVLDLLFYSTTKISTWYHGPFQSDWTPVATALSNWAGAGSGPLATELPDAKFDESGRQAATFASASSSQSITSSTSTTITMSSSASNESIYGSTLNEIATIAYNATDKILLAATRFSAAKTGLGEADVVNLDYQIDASSS